MVACVDQQVTDVTRTTITPVRATYLQTAAYSNATSITSVMLRVWDGHIVIRSRSYTFSDNDVLFYYARYRQRYIIREITPTAVHYLSTGSFFLTFYALVKRAYRKRITIIIKVSSSGGFPLGFFIIIIRPSILSSGRGSRDVTI